jgi:hypothetical protein
MNLKIKSMNLEIVFYSHANPLSFFAGLNS